MWLSLLLSLPFIIFFIIAVFQVKRNDGVSDGVALCTVIFFAFVIINLIVLWADHSKTRSDIREFEAAKSTIIEQRKIQSTEYERVKLTEIIIDHNTWLAKEQYWAQSLWLNWYYDKSILKVVPIK